MKEIPVTVLVQTKNEEVGIGACLEQLSAFGEVIVVDSMSTDATKGIALQAGARVIDFSWNGRYPKKKQWQLENANTRYSWVLFLDADEVPSNRLVRELQEIDFVDNANNEICAYDIKLDYCFAGRWLRFGHRVSKRALVKVGACEFPEINDLEAYGMGELEGHYQPNINGRVVTLRGRILHNDLDPVRTWFDRHNRYSDWEAYLATQLEVGTSAARLKSKQGRLFHHMPLKPVTFFIYCYVIRLGFLDGRGGLDYALALAFYYWQIGLKMRELHAESSGI